MRSYLLFLTLWFCNMNSFVGTDALMSEPVFQGLQTCYQVSPQLTQMLKIVSSLFYLYFFHILWLSNISTNSYLLLSSFLLFICVKNIFLYLLQVCRKFLLFPVHSFLEVSSFCCSSLFSNLMGFFALFSVSDFEMRYIIATVILSFLCWLQNKTKQLKPAIFLLAIIFILTPFILI